MKTSILGCGRWASFLAWYCLRLGHSVKVYGRSGSARLQALETTLGNEYLELKGDISFTSDLSEALVFSDVVLVSIAAQQWSALSRQIEVVLQKKVACSAANENKIFVLCMKGLDAASGLRLTAVGTRAFQALPLTINLAVWLGPGHVQDFVAGKPNCMVIDSDDASCSHLLIERFNSGLIRFYLGQDLLGNEVGAAAKNVMGIAAGLLDGLALSPLKGALMARGAFEIAQLIQAMQGSPRSAYGLAHLGDYQATLFSPHSQNRLYGELFVTQAQQPSKLAEGVGTLAVLLKYGIDYAVELPICTAVDQVLHQQLDPLVCLQALLTRPTATEF